MHHVVPSFHSLYQSSVNYVWYPAFMGHLWFIIQIVCTHSPLKDCWHFTMQYLQDLLVLEMFKHPDMGEFMIYRVIFILLYEYHWKVHTMAILPHIEDCSALWIEHPTLIDVERCSPPLSNGFFWQYWPGWISSYFFRTLLWFLLTTFLISKYMLLFHLPEECIGTVMEFFAIVHHQIVKSNEIFCNC